MRRFRAAVAAATAISSLATLGMATASTQARSWHDLSSASWIGAWGATPEAGSNPGDVEDSLHFQAGLEQSFRQIVRPTVAGQAVRLRLSNAYGTQAVTLTSFTVAVRTKNAAVDPRTVRDVTFAGKRSVMIAKGATAISDPVGFSYSFGQDLAISFAAPGSTGPMTGHTGFVTSYYSPPGTGDVTSDTTGSQFALHDHNRYFVMGLDAYLPQAQGTVVAFGDSITDGTESTADGFDDYPDVLARRLNAAGMRLGIVNEGLAGASAGTCPVSNLVWGDPGALRFARDVTSWPNVRSVIILLGGNDLRECAWERAADVEMALSFILDQASAARIKALLATYPPKVCWDVALPNPCPDTMGDDQRVALNGWINAQRARVTQIIDWDKLLREPGRPDTQDPRWGTLEGVHPGPAGYAAMAGLVDLASLSAARVAASSARRPSTHRLR
jgi:lysophospholipase L1-like esterase